MNEEKIKEFINNKFEIIYAISILYPTYLIGGAIRDLMVDKEPRDLDFVFYTNNDVDADNYLKMFVEKFNLDYNFNSFGGYKINYNGIEVDLWHTKNIFDSIEYNADGLLYDLRNNKLISLTFNDFLKNGPKKINYTNNLNNKSHERLLKIKRFYKELNDRK